MKDGVGDCSTSLRLSCGLSQREEEILKCVVRGHSNKMIARNVRSHRRDDQSTHEVDLAEDTRGEPDASGNLGTRAGIRC